MVIDIINWSEVRGWIQLLFIITGGCIGIQNYIKQQAQQRFNNSYIIIDRCKSSLQKDDIPLWKEIFLGSIESTGAEHGCFKINNCQYKLSDLFASEGQGLVFVIEDTPANTVKYINYGSSIRRLSEQFNFIGYQEIYGNIDLKLIYFELGQLMDTIYSWLDLDNLHDRYPYFSKMYKINQKKFKTWSQKTYASGC